uniref:Citrate synthase 4 n=1 Tax=Arundo donax TaxID=35708 RepID=A0A0A9D0D3_ARUDO
MLLFLHIGSSLLLIIEHESRVFCLSFFGGPITRGMMLGDGRILYPPSHPGS